MYTKGEWKVEDKTSVVAGGRLVANTGGYSNNVKPARSENEANAQLIAAAPDYHELVKDMIMFNVLSPTHNRGLYARAKRIQAKVGGK